MHILKTLLSFQFIAWVANSNVRIAKSFFPNSNSYVSIYSNTSSPYRYGTPSAFAFNLIEGLYRGSDNLQNWTLNMAQALTNNIGAVLPAPQTGQYNGVVYSEQTYFNIRWCKSLCAFGNGLVSLMTLIVDWISLPVAVLVLSYAFLAVTIVQTRQRAVQPW